MIWLLFILTVLLPSVADAACTKASTTYTCTGDLTTLKDLFRNGTIAAGSSPIQEGDTVHVTAGTWVWTGPLVAGWVTPLPGFTFEGASTSTASYQGDENGTTVFQRGAGYSETGTEFGGFMVFRQVASAGLTTLKEFTIDGNSSTSNSAGFLVLAGEGLDKFRAHHITLANMKSPRAYVTQGNKLSAGALEYSGLFDHTRCKTVSGGSVQCYAVFGSWQPSNLNAFLFPKSLGTNHSVYVEDSTCEYASTADDCTDQGRGGKYVFRYNTSNFSIGVHGADSSQRGLHQMEVYRNTFNTTTAAGHTMANWRTGPDVMFDNSYASNYAVNMTFTLYRTVQPQGPGSPATKCDGTSAWDGNLGTGTPAANGVAPTGNPGYPCLDQTGWFFTGATANGTNAVLTPAYFWNNSRGGANATYLNNDQPAGAGCTIPSCGVYSGPYIVANRDFYTGGIVAQTSSSSPFDGTTGVGWGTLARRPATCTAGVSYWATDQGTWNVSGDGLGSGQLSKCTATNTWTLYYEPYTYPHPLQGSAPAIPTAPTALRVIGTSTGTTCTVTWAESGMAGLVGYHLYSGTATGVYSRPTITKTAALSATAHQPPRQHTFQFPAVGTYYITVTSYSATVADSAASSEVTCTSTGATRTAAGVRTPVTIGGGDLLLESGDSLGLEDASGAVRLELQGTPRSSASSRPPRN